MASSVGSLFNSPPSATKVGLDVNNLATILNYTYINRYICIYTELIWSEVTLSTFCMYSLIFNLLNVLS